MFTNLSDRRKTYRIYNPIPVVCEIVDTKTNNVVKKTVMAKDISSEGIYFEIGEVLPLNTTAKVSFRLPKSDNTIEAMVKIARVEATEYENIFGIGVNFDKIEEKDKQEIIQLIDRHSINRLLELAIKRGASDLHLLADQPPVLRIDGEIQPIEGSSLSPDEILKLVYSIMSRQQIKKFEQEKELDFGIQYDIQNRFRVNLHLQRGFMEATLRLINTKIPSFEDLKLPEALKDLARLKDGLILIAGPTGSGKTTTIAALVELINQEKKGVIIILERPIEYVYLNAKSIIKQREVGIDTNSFSVALKSSLRQDPNVIIVGELDDMETIKTAIIAAETGYLVIASFHAPNTLQALDRLAGTFPPENRKQILSQLANCMKGIVSQLLLPRKDRKGRILATEVVIVNDAARRIIRNDELVQLPTVIQLGSAYKMQSMADSIRKHSDQGIIDAETANFFSEEFGKYNR